MNSSFEVRRLKADDLGLAHKTLRIMAEVFEEPSESLSNGYVTALLARSDFWVLAALKDGAPIGGVTAHALPMTRSEATELFIYDLAVQQDHQRQGIGRALIETLRELAEADGITVAFVPADNEDAHALSFYRALDGVAADVTIFTWE